MKKFIRWLAGITGALIVLLVILVLVRDPLMKLIARSQIEAETGLRAEIGEFKTTLGTGVFEIRNLKLYNPPEFGGSLMADVPELVVDVSPEKAANGVLQFQLLKLELTALNIVKRADGRLNLDGVEKKLRERIARRKKKKGKDFEFEFGGIAEMRLTVRKVQYTDLKLPTRTRALDLAVQDEVVTDLKTEEDLQRWAGAMMFRILMHISLGDRDGTALEQANTKGLGVRDAGLGSAANVSQGSGANVATPLSSP